MTGPKLNEKNFVAGSKGGTKASALYVRSSASKARLVLNVIRDMPVKQADEVLQFTDKGIAVTIRKILASAVANAQHNDQQDPDELFVKACFADEGPTLRRFAARARGRGTRINKRTCHITVVLDRLNDDRLAVWQAKEANRTAAGRRRGATSSTAARRERVERSRDRAQGLKSSDETTSKDTSNVQVESLVDETTAEMTAGEWAGSALPKADGSAPEGFEVKGNADSMLYHVEGSRYYAATVAEVYFDTAESAEAAGFAAPGGGAKSGEAQSDAGESAADAVAKKSSKGAEGSASDEAQSDAGESAADAKEDN